MCGARIGLMAADFSLQAVLDVASRRLEVAGLELQSLGARRQQAQSKLDQLLEFQDEYRSGLARALTKGLEADRLRDYRAFLDKLTRAIEVQTAEVRRCQDAWEHAYQQWLELRAREQAMLVLKQRHGAAAVHRERRQEQKQQDEFALGARQAKRADRR